MGEEGATSFGVGGRRGRGRFRFTDGERPFFFNRIGHNDDQGGGGGIINVTTSILQRDVVGVRGRCYRPGHPVLERKEN